MNDNQESKHSAIYRKAMQALLDDKDYFEVLTAGQLPGKKYPVVKYAVVDLGMGYFAVEARAKGFPSAKMVGFTSAEEAAAWIEKKV